MSKKLVSIFSVFVVLSIFLVYRLYSLTNLSTIQTVGAKHGGYTLRVAKNRGMIYDRNLKPLVNLESEYIGAILPTPASYSALLDVIEDDRRTTLSTLINQNRPFAMTLPTNKVYANGVDIFKVYQRYLDKSIAPHIIGYTDSENSHGVTGIEREYDEQLANDKAVIDVKYTIDAVGNILKGTVPQVNKSEYEMPKGVALTIDKDIQLLCQDIAEKSVMKKGAIVVMEPITGDILGLVSMPTYSQTDVESSLIDSDSPLINRAFSAFTIGSVFKTVVAAAALENGISSNSTYNCTGKEDVKGQIFKCNRLWGHGTIDMKKAIEVSCNTYFINLIQKTGYKSVIELAKKIGFGQSDFFSQGMQSAAGSLQDDKDLFNPAEIGNLSFGQGKLLVTPIQIAKLMSVFANGGYSVTPRLVSGMTDNTGKTIEKPLPIYSSNQVMKSQTARLLSEYLVNVVAVGSGIYAKPEIGGAGGKTGSAQTGIKSKEKPPLSIGSSQNALDEPLVEDEIVHAWFAGFYPAVNPRYSITVLVENGQSGALVAGPIFKAIADGLENL